MRMLRRWDDSELIQQPAWSGELVRLPCDKPDMGEKIIVGLGEGTNQTMTTSMTIDYSLFYFSQFPDSLPQT